MAAILDEFAVLTNGFEWSEFKRTKLAESESDDIADNNDPAVLDACSAQGHLAVLATPGLKRRYRTQAMLEAPIYVMDGYDIARFVFGTFGKPVTWYSSTIQERSINSKRLRDRGLLYDWDALMRALAGPALDAFEGMSKLASSILVQVAGERLGTAARLTMMQDGLRLALAEEELFHLRTLVPPTSRGD